MSSTTPPAATTPTAAAGAKAPVNRSSTMRGGGGGPGPRGSLLGMKHGIHHHNSATGGECSAVTGSTTPTSARSIASFAADADGAVQRRASNLRDGGSNRGSSSALHAADSTVAAATGSNKDGSPRGHDTGEFLEGDVEGNFLCNSHYFSGFSYMLRQAHTEATTQLRAELFPVLALALESTLHKVVAAQLEREAKSSSMRKPSNYPLLGTGATGRSLMQRSAYPNEKIRSGGIDPIKLLGTELKRFQAKIKTSSGAASLLKSPSSVLPAPRSTPPPEDGQPLMSPLSFSETGKMPQPTNGEFAPSTVVVDDQNKDKCDGGGNSANAMVADNEPPSVVQVK